jgi:hypothetical protein
MRAARIVVILALVFMSGCGGAITHDELARGIQTIGSQAAEGALVADGVAQDRTKVTFTRVQAGELAGRATHEAEKLSDAQAAGKVAAARTEAVQLAENVSDALGELQVKPRDRALARDLAGKLRQFDARATRLADGL